MAAPEYDERYIEYVELFNERYFYDSHEALEDLWLDNADESRRFYQGLIHMAAAFLHLFRGKMPGCEQRFATTLRYLSEYPDYYEGLDVAALRENIAGWQGRLHNRGERVIPYHDPDVPNLKLDQAAGHP